MPYRKSRPNMARVQAGVILGGKYRLERPIGRGGMGWVWMAQHLEWQAPVAIKLIDVRHLDALRTDALKSSPAQRADSPLLQRFFNEARAAASIRSPHVVQILDHGVDPILHLPFIVMELLEGETLDQRLAREGRLSPEMTTNILGQVARALTRVHEANMVHRDLKPSNVFLVANEDDVVAKVLDFGIAKANPDTTALAPVTATGEQMGTPFYMSPEQVRGQRTVDFRADLWAFGVIAYECLTGSRPFDGETLGVLTLRICVEPLPLPSRVGAVPAEFDAWFLRAVDRDRSRTFSSAKHAADALRSALGTGAISSPPSPRGQLGWPVAWGPAGRDPTLDTTTAALSSSRPPPSKRRQRHAAVALTVAAILGAVGTGSYLFRAQRRVTPETLDETRPSTPTAGNPTALGDQTTPPKPDDLAGPQPSSFTYPDPASADEATAEFTRTAPAGASRGRDTSANVDSVARKRRLARPQATSVATGVTTAVTTVPPSPAAPTASHGARIESPLDLIENRL